MGYPLSLPVFLGHGFPPQKPGSKKAIRIDSTLPLEYTTYRGIGQGKQIIRSRDMRATRVAGKNKGQILLYALSTCVWCKKTKQLLDQLGWSMTSSRWTSSRGRTDEGNG